MATWRHGVLIYLDATRASVITLRDQWATTHNAISLNRQSVCQPFWAIFTKPTLPMLPMSFDGSGMPQSLIQHAQLCMDEYEDTRQMMTREMKLLES